MPTTAAETNPGADRRTADGGRETSWAGLLAGSIALAAGAAVLIVLLRGESYWNYSDGVYAYTARAILHGGDLYGGIAAAQPPLVYLGGSALLAVSDSVMGLRLGLGLVQAATAVLSAVIVFRLTRSRGAALAGSILALLAPRTLHDFANLLPETIGTPLVLGAALAAARPKWCLPAGALGALAILTKLPFLFPVAAIFWFSADRRRFLVSAVASGGILALLFTVIYGTAFLEGTLLAQSGSGLADWSLLRRELAQAFWNLLPVVPLVALALVTRADSHDPRLERLTVAGLAGSLAIFATVIKHGAYINLAVAAEPFLVILALCGTVRVIHPAGRTRFRVAVVAVCWLFFLAQAVSLLARPDNPEAFAQPFDRSNHGRIASPREVRTGAALLRANRCNRSHGYYSSPFMAFAANIRLPGNQGDPFIIHVSDVYAKQRRLAESEACP